MDYKPELTIQELEQNLRMLPELIRKQAYICVDFKEKWMQELARFDLASAKRLMLAKLENHKLTGPELRAIVTEATHELWLNVILAESEFHRAEAKRDEYDNKFVAVRKVCELRRIAGHGEGG